MPPTGTVTFLFSDIEGSSRLWERHPRAMGESLRRHDEILRTCCVTADGHVFKTIGDAFCVAFDTASDALIAAVEAQRALSEGEWPETGPLRVRMAIHTGAAEFRDGDYFGNPLNRVARILSAGHGGQILVSLPGQELLRDALPDGVCLIDLGERRLRDLSRPEHLYQAAIDGMASEFPPLRSLEVIANNLPPAVSSFVGRSTQLKEVCELLGTSRLLTLTGMGGTGKTRLSLQVARSLLEEFPGGVWFIELAQVNKDDQVACAVAQTIGLREEPDLPVEDSLVRYLRDRELLLIFDNCEHLVGGAASVIEHLLQCCPKLTVLATSRHSLGVGGEQIWSVPPLTTLDPKSALVHGENAAAALSQFEAVRLFIDRATTANSKFGVTRDNAPAIAQICWRLDGIPLAIELAAARIKVLSPEQIASRLDDRFRLLTGGGRSVLPHQKTLRALIDWSYDLLNDAERLLFRRMAIFAGGRSLEAVEAVCADESMEVDVLDLLQSLVDKSLVTAETGRDGEVRFTMIESVWQYGREKLGESGELVLISTRHLDFFHRLAVEIGAGLEGRDLGRWLGTAEADRVNFRRAIAFAATGEGGSDAVIKGLAVGAALTRYFEIRGNVEEGAACFQRLLAAPGADRPSLEKAHALAGAARMEWIRDRSDTSKELFAAAIKTFREVGAHRPAALAGAMMGFAERNLGNLEQSEACFLEAKRLGIELNDPIVEAVAESGLGTVALAKGDAKAAIALKERSLAMYRKLGDRWITGYLLWGVAKTRLALDDARGAREALDEWVEIARDLRNQWTLPYALQAYADAELIEGSPASAARWLGAAEAAREALAIELDPAESEDLEHLTVRLNAALDPTLLDREWKAGRELSAWEAIDAAARASRFDAAA